MKPSRSEFLPVRGLRYHLRRWGTPGAPRLWLLHGWMDASATFQFMVDALAREWDIVAPDWRGFGLSEGNGGPYWFPDYIADLDALLDAMAQDAPANIVGHSMGGNIANYYAGIRPERVGKLVSLEGYGLSAVPASAAPERYARWLDQLRAPPAARVYGDVPALARRLQREQASLGDAQAAFLAAQFARPAAGGVTFPADPWHRLINPVSYRLEEAMACWRRVRAPVLWISGADSDFLREFARAGEEYRARMACFADIREEVLAGAGHMLHREQPQAVARLVEGFLTM